MQISLFVSKKYIHNINQQLLLVALQWNLEPPVSTAALQSRWSEMPAVIQRQGLASFNCEDCQIQKQWSERASLRKVQGLEVPKAIRTPDRQLRQSK